MGGFAPLPTKLKVLRGVGKYRINYHEPKAQELDTVPLPPHHLIKEARQEWKRMAPILWKMGVLTDGDTKALELYCETWARYREAEKMIRQCGLVSTTNMGICQSPYVKVSTEALRLLLKMLQEFGCTPSARSRIKTDPKQEDELDEYLS